jgi:hypothetical protein
MLQLLLGARRLFLLVTGHTSPVTCGPFGYGQATLGF